MPIALLTVMALSVALLAGCSGAGAPAHDITGSGLRTLAQDHLSAVMQFRSWAAVLYVKTSGTTPPPTVTPVPGGTRYTTTNSDGSEADFTVWNDGSSTGTVTFPNGLSFTSEWEAPVNTPGLETIHGVNTYPNGARLVMTSRRGSSLQPYTQIRSGEATTADGRTATFELKRRGAAGPDEMSVSLPAGAGDLSFVMPLQPEFGAPSWPNFTTGVSGDFAAGARSLDFTATGDQDTDVWQHWVMHAPDGHEADFTLGEGLSGQGPIVQNGTTVALLNWTADLVGTLDLLGAGLEEVNPSAAARDFQIERWTGNAAALGPMPIY